MEPGDRCRGVVGPAPEQAPTLADEHPAPYEDTAVCEAMVMFREAQRRRRTRDFAGAARLAEAAVEHLGDPQRAEVSCELGLAAAQLDSLSRLSFPGNEEGRRRLAARLRPTEVHVANALGVDAACMVAHLLAGVSAYCRDADEDAAGHLDQVDALLAAAEEAERRLLPAVWFHRALARLRLLEPGSDAAAYEEITASLAAGYRPPPSALIGACHALAAHASPHAPELAARAALLVPGTVELAGLVGEAARRGDGRYATAARNLARVRRTAPDIRFDLLTAVLAGAELRSDDEGVNIAADEIELLLVDVCDGALEAAWVEQLRTDHVLRSVLGPANADLARTVWLRRGGRIAEAAELARTLFHRAVAGAACALDGDDLLDLIIELGVGEEEIAGLRRLLVREVSAVSPPGAEGRPVTVLFVGGNETQQRYHQDIDAAVEGRHEGHVHIEWMGCGWNSNWAKGLQQIQARLARADVLVIMSFVRTSLGERVRAAAGTAGVPWVACTGHGRAAMQRAIERGVALARRTMI
ncbi:MAG: hypothetical protein ACYDD7_08955 [Acidimicrobiales bacterium]